MLIYDGYTRLEWDDMRVPLEVTRINPATSKPDYDTFKGGTKVHLFDKASEESVTFSIQLPHGWKEGTVIKPHVHWCPVDTGEGNVIWGLEYTLANPETGTFGDTVTSTVTQAAGGTAYLHQKAAFDEIAMTGQKISTMLICRLYRDADAEGDTYDNDAACLEIDFHIQKESIGSYKELTK